MAGLFTFALGVPAANAGFQDIQLVWWVEGTMAGDYSITGTPTSPGMVNYNGSFTFLDPLDPFQQIRLEYDFNGKSAFNVGAFSGALLSGNLVLENLFANDVDIQVQVILPVNPVIPIGSLVGGSAGVALTTDSLGGTVQTLANTPLWRALIDGSTEQDLYPDFFDMQISGLGSISSAADFGLPNPLAGSAVLNSIGIDISFNITSLDQVGITSVFVAQPIPAPGGLLVLLAAGAGIRRRRR